MEGYKRLRYGTVEAGAVLTAGRFLISDGRVLHPAPKSQLPRNAEGMFKKLGLPLPVSDMCFSKWTTNMASSSRPCAHPVVRFISDMARFTAYKGLSALLNENNNLIWNSIGGYYRDEIVLLTELLKTHRDVPRTVYYNCFRPNITPSDRVYNEGLDPVQDIVITLPDVEHVIRVTVQERTWTLEDDIGDDEPADWYHEVTGINLPVRPAWFSTCFDVLYYLEGIS